MSQTVGYVCDQIHIFAFLSTQQTVYCIDNYLDDIDVLPFIETTDIIRFGNLSVMENYVDGPCVIYYIQPVAYILTLAVYRQWLAVTDIINKQWNQLFRELIRTVVVRAVCNNGRMPYVSWKARTKWSLLAFEAEYGLCGLYFVSS